MSEEIDEPLEQAVQHGMALSAQVGRELARAWRGHLEQKARRDEKTAALVQAAFNKERDLAAVTLAPVTTAEWWDEAKVPEILEAYEIANAWAEHDPRAATAEETLRLAAAERYGFDPQKLLEEGHQFTEHLKNTDPARLAEAQRWARVSQWEGPPSYYPEAQKIRTLLRDYDAAVATEERNAPAHERAAARQAELAEEAAKAQAAQEAAQKVAAEKLEGAAAAEQQKGDVLAEEAKDHAAAAERGQEETAGLDRDAEQPSPAQLDEARAWAMANDPEYAAAHAAEKDRLDRELLERWQGSGDPDKAAQADATRQETKQREVAGAQAATAAGAAYDRSSQLQAEADRMRAAGAPEKAVAAKQFGEAQQKFPVSHAATGNGKSVGKVKANPVQQTRTQGKHLSQGR